MKTKEFLPLVVMLLYNTPGAFGQGSAFTFQGRLTDNAVPANGSYDLQFILGDAAIGGNSLSTNQIAPVAVSNGLFTVLLDFGSGAFDGTGRWLQIGVRTNGSGSPHVAVTPAQQLTPAPYAIHSGDVPTGSIMAYMGTNAPAGWLLCDGTPVGRIQYARLYAVIGVANGSGDGMNTFNLPDLRGMFLRGLDGTAGIDPEKDTRTAAKPGGNAGNALGSLQQDQFKAHNHANGSFFRLLRTTGTGTVTSTGSTPGAPDVTDAAPLVSAGGGESRPKNIYVNYIIKL
jgi:microcystin-dependent protein